MSKPDVRRYAAVSSVVAAILAPRSLQAGPKARPYHEEAKRTTRPERATFSNGEEMDYASLPLMEDQALTGGTQESFTIKYVPPEHPSTPTGREGPSVRFPLPDANIRIGDVALVPGEVVYSNRYAGFELPKDPVPQDRRAVWFMLASEGTARRILLLRYEGHYDKGAARAVNASRVFATAVVPGKVYAFRRCLAGCDAALDGIERSEEIGIVARHAFWSGTTDALTDPTGETGGTEFVVRTASIEPGSSASLSIISTSTALRRDPKGKQEAAHEAADVEVVWPKGSTPELTLFSGAQEGAPPEVKGGSYNY